MTRRDATRPGRYRASSREGYVHINQTEYHFKGFQQYTSFQRDQTVREMVSLAVIFEPYPFVDVIANILQIHLL